MRGSTYKKLLLIGSSKGNAHLLNFKSLIAPYFDEILLVSGHAIEGHQAVQLDFSLRQPFRIYKNIKALRKIIQDFNPDIIHVHQANSYGLISTLANAHFKPLVLTTWGSDVLVLPNKNWFYKAMVRFVLKRAQRITADAQYMATAIQKLAPEKKVVVANFGVEINAQIAPQKKEKFIYSNRMHENLYRIDELIIQSVPFLKAHPDWKLIIGASGSQTAILKQLAAVHLPAEAYEFVGFLKPEDNNDYYAKAHIYISIPESDGTAISLLEAMAHGCIPIVSNLPANKEWINSGENGLIYHSDLSADIEAAICLDAKKVATENKKLIAEKASKSVNQEHFFKLYDQLLDQRVAHNNRASQ
ncbi:MAG: glycosyltransferase family 4 protein [Flavobacteriales bacterium]